MNEQKQSDIARLESKIKELVPDIMELKMGCVVKIIDYDGENDEYPLEQIVSYYIPGGFDEQEELHTIEGGCITYDVKVLGRPITLEDVLMGLNRCHSDTVDRPIHLDWRCTWIKHNCIEIVLAKGHPNLNIVVNYELGKNLSEQSEETITNLLKIFEV